MAIAIGNTAINDVAVGNTAATAIALGSMTVWSKEEPIADWLCFTAKDEEAEVTLTKNGSPDAVSLETSTDGSHWSDYSVDNTIYLTNIGDKVYFRAKNENQTFSKNSTNYYYFVFTGHFEASGNIQSLLKADCSRTDAPAYCYLSLFKGCTSLTTAPELPATTLADYCYYSMFFGCTSLTAAPELPAMTLAGLCYTNMFLSCLALSAAPELPATSLAIACYSGMFINCSSLSAAPATLPAMTLAGLCYYGMFYNCSSLSAAPELPATELAPSCYCGMFQNCDILTEAPYLPATALSDRCYRTMFLGCDNLSSVSAAFTDWNEDDQSTQNWLRDVAASGTFTCPAALDTSTRDASHVPVGWNIAKPDDLLCFTRDGANTTYIQLNKEGSPDPVSLEYSTDGATWTDYSWTDGYGDNIGLEHDGDKLYFRAKNENLTFSKDDSNYYQFVITGMVGHVSDIVASGNIQSLLKADCSRTDAPAYCYLSLFKDCDALVTAPTLPATSLAIACYSGMFEGCTALASAPALPATTLAQACYYGMFYNCSSLSAAPDLPATQLVAGCYYGMFAGCGSLSSANVSFIDWGQPDLYQTTYSWMLGVAASGTFTCPAILDTSTRDASHVPSGWTVVKV